MALLKIEHDDTIDEPDESQDNSHASSPYQHDDDDETQKINRYNALPLTERIKVIEEHKKGRTRTELGNEFKCSIAQISFILKHRKEYEKEWENNGNPKRVRRSISPHVLALGIILFEYVWRMRHYPVSISDDNLKTLGKEISLLLGMKAFRTSKRWLERFKNCYRLDGSALLTHSVVKDEKPKKSINIQDIFEDMASEFKCKFVTINNLGDEHLCALKTIRAMKLNNSLGIDPRRKQVKVKRISRYAMKTGLPIAGVTKSEPTDDEQDVEFVEILPDQGLYESESESDSKFTQDFNSEYNPSNALSTAIEKDIETYGEAIEYLKNLENFAMSRGDLRAIGLINQLENYLKEKYKETN